MAGSFEMGVRPSGDADEVRPVVREAEAATGEEVRSFDDLAWLGDIVDGDLFTPMEDRPARSFDFGADGYTASVNLGQELLQITAPDQHCGLLYVRGSFANNPDAILARAQRRVGGKSTFGLKLVSEAGSDFETDFRSQGYVNFRWPIAEYRLDNADSQPGTCIAFSFVRNGTVFQVLRLEAGDLKQTKDDQRDHSGHKKPEGNEQCSCGLPIKDRRIKIRAGGTLRICCPCKSQYDPENAIHRLESSNFMISCSHHSYKKRLDIQLFINGEMVPAEANPEVGNGPEVTMAFEKDLVLAPGKAALVVATFSLRDPPDLEPLVMPSSNDLAEDLGVSKSSSNATDRLWVHQVPIEHQIDFYDLCTAARCLEQILGVNSAPIRVGNSAPSSASSSKYHRLPSRTSSKSHTSVIDKELATEPILDFTSAEPIRERGALRYSPKATPHLDKQPKELYKSLARQISNPSSSNPPDQIGPEKPVDNVKTHEVAGQNGNGVDEGFVGALSEVPTRARPIRAMSSDSKLEISTNGSAKDPFEGFTIRPSNDRDNGEACSLCDTNLGIALIRDIMCHQSVDLASSFWQIRFLVKTHNFLAMNLGPTIKLGEAESQAHCEREDSSLVDRESLDKIRTSYLKKIKFHLYHALMWIANAQLDDTSNASVATEPYSNGRNEGCWFWERSQDFESVLFAPIAIWFVIKHCPQALPESFCTTLADNLDRLRKQYSRPVDLTRTDQPAKLVLLIWYSYGCFDQIYQWLLKTSPGSEIKGFWNDVASKTRAWQKKAEKAMATARKQLVGLYSDEYESVDRLTFLGVELGLVSNLADTQSKSCISQARRRILERLDTKKLNSGEVLFDQDKSVRTSTASPWELSCVNHHSRLLLWNDPETDRYDVDFARSQCLRFLTADFSYVCSWDMSRHDVAALWWDLDAATLICSTNLDMRVGDMLFDGVKPDEDVTSQTALQKSQRRLSKTLLQTEVSQDNEALRSKEDSGEQKESSEDIIADLLRKQLDKQDKIIQALEKSNEVVSEFDWRTCEPPGTFHLDAWVQSLDDTPELFRSAQTKTVQLRNGIQQYLLKAHSRSALHRSAYAAPLAEDALAPPEWTENNIFDYFTVEEMRFLSVFNICMDTSDDFFCLREGRLSGRRSRVGHLIRSRTAEESERVNGYSLYADTSMTMWIAYLAGYAIEDSAGFMELPDRARRIFKAMTPTEKAMLKDPIALKEVENDMKRDLLRTLNDSLLDQSTRHRIFFLQRCSPAVVKGFIYMWHTQSLDTFDDHFRDSSHFFDTKKDDWITSITLSYWGCKKTNEKSFSLFHEGRDKAPFPPRKVMLQKKIKAHIWRRGQRERPEDIANKEIEEGSSSLVISGDIGGNWWTCSVISTILSETAMSALVDPTILTLSQFVHQPVSGRCLIFLSFLGALCESISAEYEGILSELTDAIKLGRQVLKQGLDWTHGEEAIQKLKAMLWALEALRIFDDRLSESLDKIREAKQKIQKYLTRGRRAEELERQCQILIEEFDKRYGRLLAVHIKIEQKIVQISRYREGISAVSNLEDTRAALTQNDTIRILTYITIAYLPPSFVAALFSVQFVSDNLDISAFAGLLAGFLIATLLLARSLSTVIAVWELVVRKLYKMITRKPRNYHDAEDIIDDDEEIKEEKVETINEKHSDFSSVKSRTEWPLIYKRRSKNGGSKMASSNEGKSKLPADVITAIAIED